MPTAVTRGSRPLVVVRPRQRVVAPLPRDRIRSRQDLVAYDDPRSCPGADNHAKHDLCTSGGAVRRFGHGKAVRIVGNPHVAAKPCPQILEQRLADQPDGIRVLDEAGRGRQHAGNPDADGTSGPGALLERRDGGRDGVERRRVVTAGCVHAKPRRLPAAVERDGLDLGPTEINTDAQHRPATGRARGAPAHRFARRCRRCR